MVVARLVRDASLRRSIRRFQIDQKKANSAQISLLREICAIFAVFFLFIIIKIKKISPETRIIRPTSKRSPCNLKPSNNQTGFFLVVDGGGPI